MTIKHLGAVVALGALGLVVACSSNGAGVVPSPSGGAIGGAQASAVAGPALQPDGAANKETPPPIKLVPASLTFSALGVTKHFVATEAGYKGKFKITNPCGKKLDVSSATGKGPRAVYDVKDVSEDSCTLTVSDSLKHKVSELVLVLVATPTPGPTAAPTATPTAHPTSSPTASPTPTVSPSPSPTASPTTAPSSSPGAIQNGNFATGTLAPWYACSYARSGFAAPINASPAPYATPTQSPGPYPTIAPGTVSGLAAVVTPPPNLNPLITATAPPLGSYVAIAGSTDSETPGTAGICQQIAVNASNPYLSFWAYEAGAEDSYKYGDQEADILDSTGTTLQTTLFSELNCFYDPGVVGYTGYDGSGCTPNGTTYPSFPGTSSHTYWQGGYWVQRGPYNLSSYAGTTVTLFIGVWDLSTETAPATYSNEIFVGNVQLTNSSTFPTSFPSARHRTLHKPLARPLNGVKL